MTKKCGFDECNNDFADTFRVFSSEGELREFQVCSDHFNFLTSPGTSVVVGPETKKELPN